MYAYHKLLRHVLENGQKRSDRTGTGTIGVFGTQSVYDLSRSFPLVTTKKMFFDGVVDELLWFLSGSTNYKDLPKRSQHWWSPWADEDGNLGAIYGEQYRKSRWFFETTPKIFESNAPAKSNSLFCGVGDLGDMKRKPHEGLDTIEHILKNTWRDMLKRCYSTTNKTYKSYGAKGVHVCDRWLHFPTFFKDAQELVGWELKKEYPDDYSLDKDILFASNRYSKATCMWASAYEQHMNTSTNKPFTAVSPEGKTILFSSVGEAFRDHKLNMSAVHRCLNGDLKTHHSWNTFKYVSPTSSDLVCRFREVDQLKLLIAGLKHSPYSRRHIINLWHTPAMQHTELPCCHGSVIQFYVHDNKLSSHVYQRSGDIFIGVPVNIASYALLTCMVAQATGLERGKFVHTIGDAHIYLNHLDQVELQLSRMPLQEPQLLLDSSIGCIFDFKYENIHLVDYNHYPSIKAPVAV